MFIEMGKVIGLCVGEEYRFRCGFVRYEVFLRFLRYFKWVVVFAYLDSEGSLGLGIYFWGLFVGKE